MTTPVWSPSAHPKRALTDDPNAGTGASELRILIVTARFPPEMGGIETHVREVGARLVTLGFSVRILTTDRSGRLPVSEDIAGLSVQRVRAWPAKRDYYFAPGIFREILAYDCDVVHIQGCHTLVPPLAMLAALVKRIPYVVTFHSGGHSSSLRNGLRSVQWRILAPLFRHAVAWIGVSRYEADSFSAHMGLVRERVHVIPNGADMPPIVKTPRTAGLRIASIGRLEKYKGHHRAIRAFAEVLKRHPDAELRIVGDGPYRKDLEELVEELELSGKVIIAGVPPENREGMSRIISNADLIMLLSDYEANPVAVMETLALNRPVLATNCSGFIELAQQSLISVVSNGSSDIAVADAVDRILCNPKARHRIDLPSWDHCTRDVAVVLDHAGRGGAP